MFSVVNNGKLPEAQSKYSAGYDVFAIEDQYIYPGEVRTIKLGFKLSLDELSLKEYENYYFGIYLRESMAKKGVMLVNGVGIINIDSTDEIEIKLFNTLKDPKGYENRNIDIKKGDRIAQIILQKHYGKIILKDSFRKK